MGKLKKWAENYDNIIFENIDKIVLGFDSYKQFAGLVKKIKPLKISSSSLLSNKNKKLINPSLSRR